MQIVKPNSTNNKPFSFSQNLFFNIHLSGTSIASSLEMPLSQFFFSLKSFLCHLVWYLRKKRKHSDFFKCGMCLNSLWGHCILYQSDDVSCLFVGWMEISKSKTYSLINWQLTDISLWETPFQYIIFIWLSFAGYSLHSHVIAPSSSTL